jgi:hypothetical protein
MTSASSAPLQEGRAATIRAVLFRLSREHPSQVLEIHDRSNRDQPRTDCPM